MVDFIGQIPVFTPDMGDGDRDDFRNVPRTDKGNRDYADKGMFGNYQTRKDQFPNPAGVKVAYGGGYDTSIVKGQRLGYGVDERDIVLGYVEPVVNEDPAYDKWNYAQRWDEPRHPDEDQLNNDRMAKDYEFRSKNRESRGFLTRPRLPRERA